MISIYPHELVLIDSPLFQRLRRVNQTSLTLLTYPCSVHSRFEHSLGSLAVAERVLCVLRRRAGIDQTDFLEVRLASLVHDLAHGPLSHTSEAFYTADHIFKDIKNAHPELFKRANSSEILTYCLITCEPFQRLWQNAVNRYASIEPYGHHLVNCDFWKIATMIVGADGNTERPASSPGPKRRFLTQLINGPFDVDKLDYLARDGYFTGLNIAPDVERLMWVLDTMEKSG